ncbi:dihydropyrimidinase [Dictyocaulus viviparus]|uniref:dihydropyrimidinase n=1 Tax=Dictyocaulus viviparus TaxID=29172 RepID=A0A0D8XRU0_DICVI|nr:dihydropyrimidinase [Dictyocaulus viviparus]
MALLIVNGTVVNEDAMFKADVLIKDGIIIDVGLSLKVEDDVEVLDANGKLVIPGGIDPHTHMQLPFMGEVAVDDFYHGTRAALAGGTTMIIDFIIPTKESSPILAYNQWRKWADPKVCCDYALSMAITSWNSTVQREMEQLVKPEYGINSFKFFLAYSGMFMVSDEEFYQGMLICSRLGALARVHAENGSVIAEKSRALLEQGVTGPEGHAQSRPEELEAEATNRACVMASQANCPLYVVHVMSRGAAEVIAHHRQKGNIVFGEPIVAGLAVDGSHYYDEDWSHAAQYVMSPPLSRDPSTPETLMDLLAAGELHLTGSDNCTFNCHQKLVGRYDFTKIPNGVNGVEDRMSLVWDRGVHSGKIDPMRFVQITSGELHLTGSDNCTFNCHQKLVGRYDFTKIPNGVNGVEDRMSLVWDRGVHSGKIDPMRFVQITSSMAAKLFNIYPKKGRIAVGSDADIVIWNPMKNRTISKDTHHHVVDYNIFEGMVVHGVAETTISRGKIVWKNNILTVEAGYGRYVPLLPFAPVAFATISQRAKVMAPKAVKRDDIIEMKLLKNHTVAINKFTIAKTP